MLTTQDSMQESIKNAERLLEEGFLASADIILSHLLSSRPTAKVHIEALILKAELLNEKQEYRRAMSYYLKALQQMKIPKNAKDFPSREPVLRLSYALTCLKVQANQEAKLILSAIPDKDKSIKVLGILAKLHREAHDNKKAIDLYQLIIEREPQCIEAHINLIQLSNRTNQTKCPEVTFPSYYESILKAHKFLQQNDFKSAYNEFSNLENNNRGNIYLLLMMAHCCYCDGDNTKALNLYEQIRIFDSLVVDQMDRYAELMLTGNNDIFINKLAADLMKIDPNRPEAWLALSKYSELRKEFDKSIGFINHAITLNKFHIQSYLNKASLLHNISKKKQKNPHFQNPVKDAMVAYRTVLRLDKNNLAAYTGLVSTYLEMGKGKEAFGIANQVVGLLPAGNSKGLELVGCALLGIDGKKEQAKKAFMKALSNNPASSVAVYALSDLFISEKKHKQALDLLVNHLGKINDDTIHCKVGDVFALEKDCEKALMYYNTALSINGANENAIKGIAKIERIITGDPEVIVMDDENVEEEEGEEDEMMDSEDEEF